MPETKISTNPFAPNAEDENGPYWDPWEAMGIHCGGYSGEVDARAILILRAIRDGAAQGHAGGEFGNFSTKIAAKVELDAHEVELWQYIFCSADWCDYGTSPRGCWIEHKGDDFGDKLIAAWEAYFERQWKEPAP